MGARVRTWSDSADLLNRFLSTAMPMVGASFTGIPAPLSSSREKPRPNRTLELYLIVGQWTAGRSMPPVGRGAAAERFASRFRRRVFFFAAWSNQVTTWSGPRAAPVVPPAHFLWKCWFGTTLLCLTISPCRAWSAKQKTSSAGSVRNM